MLTPIKLPPGVYRKGTPYQTQGRWRDANFVRWVGEIAQPIGGWRRITDDPLTGRVSGIFSFFDAADRSIIVVGTSSKCYGLEGSNVFDITPTGFIAGRDKTSRGLGFGAGAYGVSTYGTPRDGDGTLSLQANHWTFDNWGILLLALSYEDGRLWYWDAGDLATPPDAELTLVAAAPIDNLEMLVTNERHVMLLGAGGNPKKIQWSDREDFETWTPTATNRAGDLLLQTKGDIQTGMKVGAEILVLTNKDAYIVEYVGVPFFYGQRKVGVHCGILGPRAGTSVLDFSVWMAADGFYTYDGQVSPLECDVWDWVYRELDEKQSALITCGHNQQFTEVWWFFPTLNASSPIRYVAWNYSTGVWTIGVLGRTHWTTTGVWDLPLAAGTDSHVYEHETPLGTGVSIIRSRPFIESSPFDFNDGGQIVYVTKLIPDRDDVGGSLLRYTFKTRFAPNGVERTYGPYELDADGHTSVRFSGRQVALRVESGDDLDWRLGQIRVDAIAGGQR